jgi:hypothetical protein
MNEVSIEYGMIIRGITYDEIYEKAKSLDGGGLAVIYGMPVETRPWGRDYIFISFGCIEELMHVDVPPRALQIFTWFSRHLPKAKLNWGNIFTER